MYLFTPLCWRRSIRQSVTDVLFPPPGDGNVDSSAAMLPRIGKDFLVRMQFNWRPLFQGRALLLTNTLSGGILLGLGDIVQQSRDKLKQPDRVRDWGRTGERRRRSSLLGNNEYLCNVLHFNTH